MKIRTEHVYPPIPIRSFDWSAVDDDTYDGPGSPIGTGATEQEAVDDLLQQFAEKYPLYCEHCGATAEHVEMMAFVANIADPICCDNTWRNEQIAPGVTRADLDRHIIHAGSRCDEGRI